MSANLKPTLCTLTGADERTDFARIAELSSLYTDAEWGLLYSPARQGTPGRYPSVDILLARLRDLPAHVRCAVHFCGAGVPNLLSGQPVETSIADAVEARGGRVQLNFHLKRSRIAPEALLAFLRSRPGLVAITQHNSANADLWPLLAEAPNHAILFDASGGRGLLAPAWPAALPVPSGYAGGLGPDTLAQELPKIREAASGRPFWIDMEGALRSLGDDGVDWFDLDKAEASLKLAFA